MALPMQHIQDRIGISFIKSIVAHSGFSCSVDEEDFGIDGTIHNVVPAKTNRGFRDDGFKLDFQLKSVYNYEMTNEYIKYALPVKNYNDLVETDIGTQRVLILFLMPSNKSEWIKTSNNGSIINNYAVWGNMRGLPYANTSSTKTILVPKKNILDGASIQNLMSKVKRGDCIETEIILP